MPFDRAALAQAVAAHGTVARIVLVQVKGSAPRPAGTSMLVWAGGASGTIGGGQLELHRDGEGVGVVARAGTGIAHDDAFAIVVPHAHVEEGENVELVGLQVFRGFSSQMGFGAAETSRSKYCNLLLPRRRYKEFLPSEPF